MLSGLRDEEELFSSALVSFEGVAEEVSGSAVEWFVFSAGCEWDDVVDRRCFGVRHFRCPVHGFSAEVASPTVALVHLVSVYVADECFFLEGSAAVFAYPLVSLVFGCSAGF